MTGPQRFVIMLLLGLAIVSAGTWQFAGAQGEKAKFVHRWEYKKLATLNEAELNVLGIEGWELIAVETPLRGASATYLKRAK